MVVKKGWKIKGKETGGMPTPVSPIRSIIRRSWQAVTTVRRRRSVPSMASRELSMRFRKLWLKS
ncbi:MAG: hypothetical protein KJ822_16615, partial [Proteobacteria bacterium]|nr:hypothetical protein [Pseudomonadota bacterium]